MRKLRSSDPFSDVFLGKPFHWVLLNAILEKVFLRSTLWKIIFKNNWPKIGKNTKKNPRNRLTDYITSSLRLMTTWNLIEPYIESPESCSEQRQTQIESCVCTFIQTKLWVQNSTIFKRMPKSWLYWWAKEARSKLYLNLCYQSGSENIWIGPMWMVNEAQEPKKPAQIFSYMFLISPINKLLWRCAVRLSKTIRLGIWPGL